MRRSTALALLTVTWMATMLIGLGNTALWEPDEPRFAAATRAMFERGDFLTPWFNGQPRFEKPILLYWLQAPFVALLGPTETAYRLPAALAGLLTILAVYRIGARLVSARAGLFAGLALATTFRFVLYARQGLTDVPVTAFVAVAVWGFLWASDAAPRESRRGALLGWAATGLAALTKGPVAVLGPAVWLVAELPRSGRRIWARLHPWKGLALAAVIALPWFLLMAAMHGQAFFHTAVGYEVVDRYLSPDFPGPQRGATYFLGAWFGDGAPWSLVALGGAVWAAFAWPDLAPGTRRAVWLAVAWWGTVILLFSFSSYKLPHYIMPAYPATALLAGVFADAATAGAARSRWPWRVPALLTAVLLGAGAVLLGLLLRRAFELPWTDPSFGLPLLLAAGGAALAVVLASRRDRVVMPVLVVTLVAAYAWLILIVSPRELRRFQPIPQLAHSARAAVPAGAPLAVAGNYGAPGLIYYANRPVEQLDSREALMAYLAQPGARALVLPRQDFENVDAAVRAGWTVVDEAPIFSVRMRRLIESEPERAARTLILVVRSGAVQ